MTDLRVHMREGVGSQDSVGPDRGHEKHTLVGFSGDVQDEFFHRCLQGQGLRWLGVPLGKNPLDLWVYHELIWEIRPDLIIETGTGLGGSALYMANVCDLVGRGEILSVDHAPAPVRGWPVHDRISYLQGDSAEIPTVAEVVKLAAGKTAVMVILDSDHHTQHVFKELMFYAPLVTPGSMLIVEDTNVGRTPACGFYQDGPREAVEAFLAVTPHFVVDEPCERFGLTFNPGGYLRRKRDRSNHTGRHD